MTWSRCRHRVSHRSHRAGGAVRPGLANVSRLSLGGLLKLHNTSAMEFPYSVQGLTDQHTSMRWPRSPNRTPDKPGAKFRRRFGAVPSSSASTTQPPLAAPPSAETGNPMSVCSSSCWARSLAQAGREPAWAGADTSRAGPRRTRSGAGRGPAAPAECASPGRAGRRPAELGAAGSGRPHPPYAAPAVDSAWVKWSAAAAILALIFRRAIASVC